MPASIFEYLTDFKSPVMRGSLPMFLAEPFRPRSDAGLDDESIHSFVSRRLGSRIADNMISALVHGIYAGDSRRLSGLPPANLVVKSCFPFLWNAEKKFGSIAFGILADSQTPASSVHTMAHTPAAVPFIQDVKAKSALYSFRDGLQTLSDAIAHSLAAHPNVEIRCGTRCTSLEMGEKGHDHLV